MSISELRREIKKSIDRVPVERLVSLADYIEFLNRPSLTERLAVAEADIKAGKGVSWRKVRRDV